MQGHVSEDFRKQVTGFGLTTATIEYMKPDAPWLINPFPLIRQFYDIFPDFPELSRYLEWWRGHIVVPIRAVTVAHSKLIKPAELRTIDGEFRLN
jgi:uncharacterized protein Usg